MATVAMTSLTMTSLQRHRARQPRRTVVSHHKHTRAAVNTAAAVDEEVESTGASRGGAIYHDKNSRRGLLAHSVIGAALSNITAAAAAAAADEDETSAVVVDAITTTPQPTTTTPPRRPAACTTGTSCVSTASFRSPANFLPPWEYTGSDADAFAKLTRVLGEKPGSVITTADEARGYVAASLRYGGGGGSGGDDVDDVEFFLTMDGSKTVLFKSQSRVNKASPPGCFTPGCINGPRNRGRSRVHAPHSDTAAAFTTLSSPASKAPVRPTTPPTSDRLSIYRAHTCAHALVTRLFSLSRADDLNCVPGTL